MVDAADTRIDQQLNAWEVLAAVARREDVGDPLGTDPTEADVDLTELYAGGDRGWTKLRRQAGHALPPPTPDEAPLARAIGLDRPRGALISQVLVDGPADKAGVEAGVPSDAASRLRAKSRLPPVVLTDMTISTAAARGGISLFMFSPLFECSQLT